MKPCKCGKFPLLNHRTDEENNVLWTATCECGKATKEFKHAGAASRAFEKLPARKKATNVQKEGETKPIDDWKEDLHD